MSEQFEYRDFYRRFLPHYQPVGGRFFITYRLAFSLPKRILDELNKKAEECEMKTKNLPEKQKKQLQRQYSKILFRMEDDFLNKYQQSPQWLKDDTIANLVLESLLFNHHKQYTLICALLMSNHVHIIIKPLQADNGDPYPFAMIMQNHKSYTAHEANKLLDRKGLFWYPENYDHYIRDEDEFYRIIDYILNNPVKAGLVTHYTEWKHYWVNPENVPQASPPGTASQ